MKGNLTRRGERSWRLKFDAGRDADGRRISKYVTLRGTRHRRRRKPAMRRQRPSPANSSIPVQNQSASL